VLEARLRGKVGGREAKGAARRDQGGALPAEAAVQPDEAPAPPEIENPPAVAEGPEAAETAPDELPPVAELAERIPPEVRATMEELFRTEWTTVRRLRPTDVKPAGAIPASATDKSL
jgi:hypothetical protein